ncbi:hypothetical protein B9Z55_009071 [Caenorhabditis nigoni]|uniref:Uncharacterized protein n=1 Tax=Caenorhabditis nigoni TaxID=1611254 RepID=A0A2G5UQD7_9PELO|nr:hypothetical protein B9Z55_009071 [Caenorhabditis nigoni]
MILYLNRVFQSNKPFVKNIYRVYLIDGYIIITEKHHRFPVTKLDVYKTDAESTITKMILGSRADYEIRFSYSLKIHSDTQQIVLFEEMFAPSDMKDAVLVVENFSLDPLRILPSSIL